MSTENPQTKEALLQNAADVLGAQALETVPLSELDAIKPNDSVTMAVAPPCITQIATPRNLQSDPTQLMVGLDDQIPRWKRGSVIKWAAWRQGFKSQSDADYAALQLNEAAKRWNEADVGVTFEWVRLAVDANFVLCHGGDLGDVVASSYFPNGRDLNQVLVYTTAFAPGYKENMWKVLTHELGHVMGLRHEHAMTITGVKDGGAVQFGKSNGLSVMGYKLKYPEIQPSDIESTKLFYGLKNGEYIGSTAIHDYEPM